MQVGSAALQGMTRGRNVTAKRQTQKDPRPGVKFLRGGDMRIETVLDTVTVSCELCTWNQTIPVGKPEDTEWNKEAWRHAYIKV